MFDRSYVTVVNARRNSSWKTERNKEGKEETEPLFWEWPVTASFQEPKLWLQTDPLQKIVSIQKRLFYSLFISLGTNSGSFFR